MASIGSYLRPAAQALLGIPPTQKSIWGGGAGGFRDLMGISGDGAPNEITDNPASYAGARTSESYVFRCMDVRAKAISQVPLRVYEVDKTGKRSPIEHDALGVIKYTNPLDYVSGTSTLMRYTLMSLDGQGRSTWKLAFNGRGVPTEIYWLPPVAVTPLHGFEVGRPDIPFGGVRFTAKGGLEYYSPEEIVYFTTDNPSDPIMGTSKIAVLKNAINLRSYSVKSNQDFFKNSMRPDWILSGQFNNTEENIERIRRAIRRHLSGESNRMPLILGEGATAHLLTTSQKDAEWLAQQRLSQEEISTVYGVPLMFVNNYEKATYDNFGAAKTWFWHDTMIGEGDQLAEALTRKFLWKYWPDSYAKRIEFGFDYNAIEGLGEDVARIWERFMELAKVIGGQVKDHQLTPNQANVAMCQLAEGLGLDSTPWQAPVPNGDDFLVQHTFVPSLQLSMQAVIDAFAARSTANAALVENIPGAEHAGDNADEIVANQQSNAAAATAAAQAHAQAAQAQAATAPADSNTDNPGDDANNSQDASKARITRRLKKTFQAIQTEALRNLRAGNADLYDRAKARQAIGESTTPEMAAKIEDDIHSSLGDDPKSVSEAISLAIERKADLYAREASGEKLPVILGPGVRVY